MDADPHSLLVAPVHHALTTLMVRGLVLVGATGALAVWIVAAKPDAAGRDGATFLALALLALYSIVVRGMRAIRGRPTLEERDVAWERAQELDRSETALGMLVVAWVPAAVCLAMTILLWPHLADDNPQIASAWAVFGVPPAVVAWLLLVGTWLDAARDDLARAEHESDLQFRSYWANLGR